MVIREPLVLPALALAAGILAARFARFSTFELFAGALGAFALIALAHYRAPRMTAWCWAFLSIFAGAALSEAHRPGPPPQLNAASGEPVIIEGCVVEAGAATGGREQFVVEIAPAARVRVTVYPAKSETLPQFRFGERVEVEARIREPRNFGNPGAFDYAGYLARKQVFWTASAKGAESVKKLDGRCGSSAGAWLQHLKATALDRIEALYPGNPYAGAVMQALLLGESGHVERSWLEQYRRTGTYHALVVSGLHVTVIAAVLLFAGRMALLPRFWASAIACLVIWLYAALCGGGAPVLRAAAAFTLFFGARAIYRRGRVLNLLAAVAIVFFVCDPGQLFEPSFQLSFIAVGAIGALATPLFERTSQPVASAARRLSDRNPSPALQSAMGACRVELRLLAETIALYSPFPAKVAMRITGLAARTSAIIYELAATSFAVQLALSLALVAYFHRISIAGIGANIIVVPALSAAVPVGFLAVLTGWQWPAGLAAWLLDISRRVVDFHAAWEPASRIADPPLWFALLLTMVLGFASVAARCGPLCRRLAAGIALCGFAILVVQPSWAAREARRGTLELTAIDVGQGESLLLRMPDGGAMLVDGGGIPSYDPRFKPKLEIGEDVVSPVLWQQGLSRLDIIVLTHAHHDHAGGLPALIENFRPRELWVGALPESPASAAVLDSARKFGVSIRPLHRGEKISRGGVVFDVIAPDPGYQPRQAPHNNDSLAFIATFGKHKLLLTGDMEREVERGIAGSLPRVDVLKVAHHGSRTSSTGELIGAAHPAIAIISAGIDNSYRHPHPDVLERLQTTKSLILRTDRFGQVSVSSDGRFLTVSANQWRP